MHILLANAALMLSLLRLSLLLFSNVQFGNKEGVSSPLFTQGSVDQNSSASRLQKRSIDIRHAFFINTDRDMQRRTHMEEQLSFWGLNFSRFVGVNGSALTPLQQAYINKRGLMHPGVKAGTIGNNLGHLDLWKKLVSEPNGVYLLMEDDILLRPDWLEGLKSVALFVPADWEVLKLDNRFVGSCSGRKYGQGKYGRIRGIKINEHIHKLTSPTDNGCNLGLGAYLINKRSDEHMQRMVDAFEAKPITVADGNIQFLMGEFNFYLPYNEAAAGKKFRWLETEELFESTRLEADQVGSVSSSAKIKHKQCSGSGLMNCGNFLTSVLSHTYLPCCNHEGLKCVRGYGSTVCVPV
jgi:GR25 family glycosyltransferase involved in LPS biosynthesis